MKLSGKRGLILRKPMTRMRRRIVENRVLEWSLDLSSPTLEMVGQVANRPIRSGADVILSVTVGEEH